MALEYRCEITRRIVTAIVMRTRDMTWTWAAGIESLHEYWESVILVEMSRHFPQDHTSLLDRSPADELEVSGLKRVA